MPGSFSQTAFATLKLTTICLTCFLVMPCQDGTAPKASPGPAHMLTGGMRIHTRDPVATGAEPGPSGSAAAAVAPDAAETTLKLGNSQIEITGFHAKRCEFEFEYDNAAEAVVADLEFREVCPVKTQLALLHMACLRIDGMMSTCHGTACGTAMW